MSLAMGTGAQAEIDSLRERLAAAEAVSAEVARLKATNAALAARHALLELQNVNMPSTLFGLRPKRNRHLLLPMDLPFSQFEAAATHTDPLYALAQRTAE